MASTSTSIPFKKVVIIGAGFSGLAMACQIKRKLKCDEFVIYDRASELGGTWQANTYPGCGVDIPAVFYSLSFAQNAEFSSVFPKQEEILNYIYSVASKFNICHHMVGNMEWVGASWKDDTDTWLVQLRDLSTGQQYDQECKVLISAVGALTNPSPFYMPGIDCFQGNIIHTAQWDHNVCLKDKDVIVIGNGASATQLVPAIATKARSITQFARSSQLFLPCGTDTAIGSLSKAVFRYVPGVLSVLRSLTFLYLETSTPQFDLTSIGASMRKQTLDMSTRYIKATAPRRYWSLLIPDTEVGCKRRIFDHDGYIQSLNRKNIHLTDDPIVAFHERSVLTKSGAEYPADVVLLATGFDLSHFDVELYGRHGRSRTEHWKDMGYIEAFNSVGMSGFPNFFYVLGPNSGRGHTSALYSIESYAGLITRVIQPIISGTAISVEPSLSSEKRYNQRLHDKLTKTVFNNSCASWFIDRRNGINWAIYPWSSFQMWWTTQIAGLEDWVYDTGKAKSKDNSRVPILYVAIFTLGIISILQVFATDQIGSIGRSEWANTVSILLSLGSLRDKIGFLDVYNEWCLGCLVKSFSLTATNLDLV